MKRIQNIRSLGEILLDPFRFIFQNIVPISGVLVVPLMLPIFVFNFIFTKQSFSIFTVSNSFSGLQLWAFFLSGLCIFLHVSLIAMCLLRVLDESESNEITPKRMWHYFKKLYLKNLLLSGLVFLILFGTVAIFYNVITGEYFAFSFLLFFVIIGLYLYVYPYILFVARYYMFEDEFLLSEAIEMGKMDFHMQYGSSIGVLFLSMVISFFLRTMISVPIILVFFAGSLVMDFQVFQDESPDIILIIQCLMMGVGYSYLLVYFYVAVYLKGFDAEERRTGEKTIERMMRIGTHKETYFENEGEY